MTIFSHMARYGHRYKCGELVDSRVSVLLRILVGLVIQGSLEPSSHQGIAHCREGPVTAGQSHRRTSSGIAVPATRTFEARPLNDNESNVEISLGSNDGFEVFSITY